jgi:hypothetical protein
MEKAPRNLGRAYLVAELAKHGVSRRLALRILNLIFREMGKALARGEKVPFPGGKLMRTPRHFSKYWDMVDDWPANRQGYTVDWVLDEAGARLFFPEDFASAPKRRRRSRLERLRARIKNGANWPPETGK